MTRALETSGCFTRDHRSPRGPRRTLAPREAAAHRVWTALWIVYIVWGSTYLAIKLAVRTLPPLLTAGTRFLAAAAAPDRDPRDRATVGPGRAARGAHGGRARRRVAGLRRRPRARGRDADRLERRRDDRGLRPAPGRRLADDRARARSAGDGRGGARRPRRARARRRPGRVGGRLDGGRACS